MLFWLMPFSSKLQVDASEYPKRETSLPALEVLPAEEDAASDWPSTFSSDPSPGSRVVH